MTLLEVILALNVFQAVNAGTLSSRVVVDREERLLDAKDLSLDAVGRTARASEVAASIVFEANILPVDAVGRFVKAFEDAAGKVLEVNDALLDGAVSRSSRVAKVLEANALPVDAVILGRTLRAVEERAGKVLVDKNGSLDGAVSGTSRAVEGTAGVKKELEENILLVVNVGITCGTLV